MRLTGPRECPRQPALHSPVSSCTVDLLAHIRLPLEAWQTLGNMPTLPLHPPAGRTCSCGPSSLMRPCPPLATSPASPVRAEQRAAGGLSNAGQQAAFPCNSSSGPAMLLPATLDAGRHLAAGGGWRRQGEAHLVPAPAHAGGEEAQGEGWAWLLPPEAQAVCCGSPDDCFHRLFALGLAPVPLCLTQGLHAAAHSGKRLR